MLRVLDETQFVHFYREAFGLGVKDRCVHCEGALMAKFFFVTDPDGDKIEDLQRQGGFA